jgi:hypothetical protein
VRLHVRAVTHGIAGIGIALSFSCMQTSVAIAAVLAMTVPARADGIYFSESFGVGRARGDFEPIVRNAIHTRFAIGARVRWLAIEPWVTADLQTDRDGAWRGLVGGEPAAGLADVESYGIAVKLIGPLYRGPSGERLEAYVRGGPFLAGGTGMLEGADGQGLAVAAGFQLTGKVRALGFLWAPLFFVKKGPMVTGALFLDQGYDFYRMRAADGSHLTARIGHVSVGFAIGSSF